MRGFQNLVQLVVLPSSDLRDLFTTRRRSRFFFGLQTIIFSRGCSGLYRCETPLKPSQIPHIFIYIYVYVLFSLQLVVLPSPDSIRKLYTLEAQISLLLRVAHHNSPRGAQALFSMGALNHLASSRALDVQIPVS
jgi:hypothetical protein